MTTDSLSLFYAWQAETSSACNQNLIRQALASACATVSKELDGRIGLSVDEATRDVPGSPNIPLTIFSKIRSADIFVADLTTVRAAGAKGDGIQARAAQNSNVLLETGVAVGCLDWGRVILIVNKAYGAFPDDLPFDIDRHRVISYELEDGDTSKRRQAVGDLSRVLSEAVQSIVENNPLRPVAVVGDHEFAKRTRDLKVFKRILFHLNPDLVDEYYDNGPKLLSSRFPLAYDGFAESLRISVNGFYDSRIPEYLEQIREPWRVTVTDTGHYIDHGERHYIWDGRGPRDAKRDADWEAALAARQQLKDAMLRLFEFVRAEYPEIDLEEICQENWTAIRAYEEETRKSIEAEDELD